MGAYSLRNNFVPVMGLSVLLAQPSIAQEFFFIDVPVVETNGGNVNVLDGNDSITVTATGSVTPPAGDIGLESTGDSNKLNNSGSVTTNGDDAHGLAADGGFNFLGNDGAVMTGGRFTHGIFADGDFNNLSNGGDVTTTGNDAYGLFADGNNNNLSNSGDVTTNGTFSHGLRADGDNNTVINSGDVTTIANDSSGLRVEGDGNVVVNDGDVTTNGNYGIGISAEGANSEIINNGSLTTIGSDAHGIRINSGNNSNVINTGEVTTSGIDSAGVATDGNDINLTNSGKIFAMNSASIDFRFGIGSTVNLREGSVLFGDVDFSEPENTLQFGPGLNAVVQLNGAIPDTITAPNDAFVVDSTGADTVIAIDSTGFVAADQGVAELGAQVLAALDRLGPGAPAPEVTQGSASADGSFTWGGAIGGLALGGETDTTAGYVALNGGIIGGHNFGGDNGVFLGLTASHQESDSSFEQNTGTLFAGVQGGWQMGGLDVKASLTAGGSSTDQTRIIANNTVAGPTMGIEEADASYNTAFVMPAITLSGDMDRGSDSFTPSLRLRYGKIMQDGYAESGSSYDLVVEDREAEFLEVRLQLERGLEDKRIGEATMSTAMRVGFDAHVFSGDNVDLTVAAQGLSLGVHDEEVVGRVFAGIDMVRIGDSGSELTAGFEAGLDTTKRVDVSGGVEWVRSF